MSQKFNPFSTEISVEENLHQGRCTLVGSHLIVYFHLMVVVCSHDGEDHVYQTMLLVAMKVCISVDRQHEDLLVAQKEQDHKDTYEIFQYQIKSNQIY